MNEIDTWRAAHLLIQQHGELADQELRRTVPIGTQLN
jgi:hypothetical protein